MSSITQARNLGVILDFSLSDPHQNPHLTLALKCLKWKSSTLHPNCHQAVFLFHLDYFDNLLTGLIASTLTSLLFSRSEMQVDNFIPLLKIFQ